MVEDTTTKVLLRIRVADRPGALSAVTRRINAVKGDLIGIEILERRGGWAVDDLVVALPNPDVIDVMVRELGAEDDVEVEDVHPIIDSPFDPTIDPFDVAAIIAGSDDVEELYSSLCAHARRVIRSDWVCLIDDSGTIVAQSGGVPDERGLNQFVGGDVNTLGEAVWMPLPRAGATFVLGRSKVSFRAKERHQAAALARIADSLHGRLRGQRRLRSQLMHPSTGRF